MAGKKKAKPCGCRERVNGALAERNAELYGSGQAWSFEKHTVVPQTAIYLAVQKLDPRKRARLPLLAATFCPFCGVDMTAPPSGVDRGSK